MMNVLLPTDFSENSRNAALYAMEFFKGVSCTMHLLHVIPAPVEKFGSGYTVVSLGVQEKMNALLDQLNKIKNNPNHHFTVSCKTNFLIEAVRQQVIEKSIDLILMGTKGSTSNKGAMIGKNTSDVMMKVKCPVLAIPENAIFKKLSEILFPTDYQIKYNDKMLGILLNLSSLSKASINIMELFNSEKEPSEEQIANRLFLQNCLSPKTPTLQTYYSSKAPNTSQVFTRNKNVDMIVMVAKNLNICHKLLKEQQYNSIPFISQLQLLVLHG